MSDEETIVCMLTMNKRLTCYNYGNGHCKHEDAQDTDVFSDCMGNLKKRPSWCPLIELKKFEHGFSTMPDMWVKK